MFSKKNTNHYCKNFTRFIKVFMVIKFIKIILLRWPFQCTQPFATSPLLSSSFSSSISGEQLMIRSMIPMQWLMITVSTQPGRPPWGLQGDCRLLRLCRHSCCSCQCEGAHTGTSDSLKLPQSFFGGFSDEPWACAASHQRLLCSVLWRREHHWPAFLRVTRWQGFPLMKNLALRDSTFMHLWKALAKLTI